MKKVKINVNFGMEGDDEQSEIEVPEDMDDSDIDKLAREEAYRLFEERLTVRWQFESDEGDFEE